MNDNVDYSAPAELFPGMPHRNAGLHYHRFDTLAEALRYTLEELTTAQRHGALIESEEIRYSGDEIAALYESPAYPLARQTAGKAQQ
jgi:hypothetical protein